MESSESVGLLGPSVRVEATADADLYAIEARARPRAELRRKPRVPR
jgi:hypothetical protein